MNRYNIQQIRLVLFTYINPERLYLKHPESKSILFSIRTHIVLNVQDQKQFLLGIFPKEVLSRIQFKRFLARCASVGQWQLVQISEYSPNKIVESYSKCFKELGSKKHGMLDFRIGKRVQANIFHASTVQVSQTLCNCM